MIEPLRILLPTDVFPPRCGGAGWSAHALASALQDRGHRVTAVVPRAVDSPRRFAGRARRFAPSPSVVLGVPTVEVPYYVPGIPVVDNLYRHEWLWPLIRNVVVHEALSGEALGNAMARRARVLVHAQHVQTIPGAILAGHELGIPVVASVRDHWPRDYFATGLHADRIPYPSNTPASLLTDLVARGGPLKGLPAGVALPYMLRHLRRRRHFLAQADAVVAVSDYIARHLSGIVARERLHVIHNIVDVDALQPIVASPPSSVAPGAPFLLYVGKLERNKGAHLLPAIIAAAREAYREGPLPELVIAGEGYLAAEIEREVAAVGGRVRLLPGWTDHDEVLRLMRHAQVLLFPSLWGEPFSRVPLEASAAGACIAAMPTGGTPEIVEDGATGVLAADAVALGRAVADLLRDPDRRARLGAAAQSRSRARWAPGVIVEHVEALYEGVLAARQALPEAC